MNRNVSLPDELTNFVKAKVGAVRYGSPSEVVREVSRLLERADQQDAGNLTYLRKA